MLKPLNGNVCVTILKNESEDIFKDLDSRKDLQYAVVEAVTEGSKLEIGSKIVYNPRNLTNIVYDDKLYGFVHETIIIAIL